MEKRELEILRKLQSGGIDQKNLLKIFDEYKGNYRIILNLIQHPAFPADFAINIISSLFTSDILKVIKNKRANPFVRKKCEIEFSQRYIKIPKGEKISLMKRAPLSLLNYFVNENDENILEIIVNNPNCTEDLIIKLVNRETERSKLYSILMNSDWIKNRRVCYAISFDPETPIGIWIRIIPFVERKRLSKLYSKSSLHNIIKRKIREFLEKSDRKIQ